MSGFGRRVRHERELWKAVWMQVEAFLDRIDGAADQDEAHAITLCQLLPVLNVIESARTRVLGYGLKPAPPATPRGVGLFMTQAAITPSDERLPGLEECEFAAAPIQLDEDEDKHLLLWPTVELSTFRDSKRFLDGAWLVPAYDTGRLDAASAGFAFVDIGDVADDGLFPWDTREDAANGEDFEFVPWSSLRASRLDKLTGDPPPDKVPLSTELAPLDPWTDGLAEFRAVGGKAAAAAAACNADRAVLDQAKTELTEVGADDALLGALAACVTQLTNQAADYGWVAQQLGGLTIGALRQQIGDLRARLLLADFRGGIGMSFELLTLETQATAVFDKQVEARIAYPDGPLRQLRMLEQGLRHFWKMRTRWMNKRAALIAAPLMINFWTTFVASAREAAAGHWGQLTLPSGTTTTRAVNARATSIHVTGIPPMDSFRPGRLAKLGGDRPAAAVVVDEGFDKHGLFLTTAAVEVSLAVTPGLAGLPGVVPAGTAVGTHFPAFTDGEWRRGAATNPADSALLTGIVAHMSKLALVLGTGYGGDRPAAPTVPGPYPGITSFALDGPVAPEAARLFLTAVPSGASSGTGARLGVARAGELVLIRGIDDDGLVWQGVAEVESCAILSGAEARKDDELTATPVPPCCADDAEVMVVTLRQLQIPATLTRSITLRRDFLGFGTRSLLAAAVLPEDLDPATTVPAVTVDGQATLVLRDHELKAAAKLFEDWLGRDTGADS